MRNAGLFAFLGGAIAGAAIAMLLTPRRGDETRQMLTDLIHRGKCPCHSGKCECKENGCECKEGDCDCPDCECHTESAEYAVQEKK